MTTRGDVIDLLKLLPLKTGQCVVAQLDICHFEYNVYDDLKEAVKSLPKGWSSTYTKGALELSATSEEYQQDCLFYLYPLTRESIYRTY